MILNSKIIRDAKIYVFITLITVIYNHKKSETTTIPNIKEMNHNMIKCYAAIKNCQSLPVKRNVQDKTLSKKASKTNLINNYCLKKLKHPDNIYTKYLK